MKAYLALLAALAVAGPAVARAHEGFDADLAAKAGAAIERAHCGARCSIRLEGRRVGARLMHISAYPGVPQYVVTMPGPENCGSAGCMSGVIVKRAGAWQVVFSGFNIWALPSLTNGFHDLIIGYKGPGFEFQGPFQRFQWDGDRYVQNQWVNISNGSAPGFSVN